MTGGPDGLPPLLPALLRPAARAPGAALLAGCNAGEAAYGEGALSGALSSLGVACAAPALSVVGAEALALCALLAAVGGAAALERGLVAGGTDYVWRCPLERVARSFAAAGAGRSGGGGGAFVYSYAAQVSFSAAAWGLLGRPQCGAAVCHSAECVEGREGLVGVPPHHHHHHRTLNRALSTSLSFAPLAQAVALLRQRLPLGFHVRRGGFLGRAPRRACVVRRHGRPERRGCCCAAAAAAAASRAAQRGASDGVGVSFAQAGATRPWRGAATSAGVASAPLGVAARPAAAATPAAPSPSAAAAPAPAAPAAPPAAAADAASGRARAAAALLAPLPRKLDVAGGVAAAAFVRRRGTGCATIARRGRGRRLRPTRHGRRLHRAAAALLRPGPVSAAVRYTVLVCPCAGVKHVF